MLHWNLLGGVFPVILIVLAVVAAIYLVARPHWRRWWTVVLPCVLAGAVGGALLIDWYVNDIWQAFTDPLPSEVVIWFGVILAAVALMVLILIKAHWRQRVLAVLATVIVVAQALNGINQYYGYYPTMADALGKTAAHQIALPPIQGRHGGSGPNGTAAPGDPTTDPGGPQSGAGHRPANLKDWRPTGALPRQGAISEVTIPPTVSKFRPRSAWVYLPPAYLTAQRPDLPVLMLIPGQFSSARTWIIAGKVVSTMDSFAAKHHGLAPIVVMPDATGSTTANTMCVDSRLGNADTYLSRDVVDWVLAHLQVDRRTEHWAVGGFSFGGTCALQLAVSHPRLFPTFLDISGQVAPTLGTTARTVATAFGGDAAAYTRVQPLHILAASRGGPQAAVWHGVTGIFVVGSQDHAHAVDRDTVMRGCREAGMVVDSFTVPGTHSWYVAAAAVPEALPRLAERMGLL